MLQELLMQPTRWQGCGTPGNGGITPNGTIQVGQGLCKNSLKFSCIY
jgi:hypothetical protein